MHEILCDSLPKSWKPSTKPPGGLEIDFSWPNFYDEHDFMNFFVKYLREQKFRHRKLDIVTQHSRKQGRPGFRKPGA